MEETHQSKLEVPSPEVIATFVRFSRHLAGWKKATLASVAEVSLSTVERVERGETVSADSLERLAVALKQDSGAFTRPRRQRTTEEAIAAVVEQWGWMADTVPVEVAPLRTQAQLRALSASVIAILDQDLGEEAADDVLALNEWLELVSFVRAEQECLFTTNLPREHKLRRLYSDVLRFIGYLERQYRCVCLVGTYRPKSNLRHFQNAEVGVVSVRSRVKDPAASERRTLLAPADFDFRAAIERAFAEDDQ